MEALASTAHHHENNEPFRGIRKLRILHIQQLQQPPGLLHRLLRLPLLGGGLLLQILRSHAHERDRIWEDEIARAGSLRLHCNQAPVADNAPKGSTSSSHLPK